MGNGAYGQCGHRGKWGTGVWGTWAMRPTGGMGYRGMGTWAIGYRGYGVQGIWATWAMGYMGNRVWGTGVWATWAIGTWAMGPMGNLHPKCQKDVKFSKRCQVVKKMSNVKNQKN